MEKRFIKIIKVYSRKNNQNIKIITEFHTSELREEGADPKEFLNIIGKEF